MTRAEQTAAFRRIITETLGTILERTGERPFLDTKFDVIDGRDYAGAAEPAFRSGRTVYAWIQGRGLEALAGHLHAGFGDAGCIRAVLRRVSSRLERIRAANGGRMFFMMSPDGVFLNGDGTPRREPLPGDANYSDLFCAKGLLHAARALQDAALEREALAYLERTVAAIGELRFVTDQQPFDPANPVAARPGKVQQGPFMIALSGIAAAAELTGDVKWLDRGCRFLRRVLTLHVDHSRGEPELFEAVRPDGTPYREDGRLISDPGHALEFAGLALKFLAVLEKAGRPGSAAALHADRMLLARLLRRHFTLGFRPGPGGIVKSFDLIGRCTVNADMPWWSLPETIRAAAEAEAAGCGDFSDITGACAGALWNRFTNVEQHCFAYQTRDASGRPVRVIPAVPDLDPGYHTNLSLIDVLKLWGEL